MFYCLCLTSLGGPLAENMVAATTNGEPRVQLDQLDELLFALDSYSSLTCSVSLQKSMEPLHAELELLDQAGTLLA